MEGGDGGSTALRSTLGLERQEAERPPRARRLPALTLLAHPDFRRIGERALLGDLAAGRAASLSRLLPHFAPPAGGVPRGLADPYLSRRPLRLAPGRDGGVEIHRDASPLRLTVGGRPLEDHLTVPAGALEDGAVLELGGRVALLLHRAAARLPGATPPPAFGLVGDSDAMVATRRAIARLADLDVPVLLRGETGTGKELVARALHRAGRRRGGPFVAVNLGALPPALAAAELFGTRRGAYTGAVREQAGYFARAAGGTLFLDEIGEAPPEVQVMLLRALEEGEVVAVGSQSPRAVEARVIAATDADLEAMVERDAFRAPLLHRLAGYTLALPPLRRHREDVGRLLLHFLEGERGRLGEPPLPAGPVESKAPAAARPWLPAGLVARLARYPWPGNARELRNAARRLAIDSRGRPVLVADGLLAELPPLPEPEEEPPSMPPAAGRRRKPAEISEEELLAALAAESWNPTAAARALGVPRASLYDLIARSPRARTAADVPPEEIRDAHRRCGGDLDAMAEALRVSRQALRQRLKGLGLR